MGVLIIGNVAERGDWVDIAADIVAANGVEVRAIVAGEVGDEHRADRIVFDADAPDARLFVISQMRPSTTIVLASAAVPLELIEAAYATPFGQASRKIVDIAEGDADEGKIAALFQIADMLIFTPNAIAPVAGLGTAPRQVDDLLSVQTLMQRHNQGVVVRFPENGGCAIWADRTMFVENPQAAADEGPVEGRRALYSGTIAAAVARKIGPQPAMEMALAAVHAGNC